MGKYEDTAIRFVRSALGRVAILIVLIMILIPLYVKGIVLILILELATFGVFEFFLRKRHLLEKKVVIPLPGVLEQDLGNVCSNCRKNVGRGNLKELEGKWICEGCYEAGEKGETTRKKEPDLGSEKDDGLF